MQTSSMVHVRPEEVIQDVVGSQKTIRTARLADLLLPVIEKVKWQEEALERNVQTIRALNDRAQKAEEHLKRARRENEYKGSKNEQPKNNTKGCC